MKRSKAEEVEEAAAAASNDETEDPSPKEKKPKKPRVSAKKALEVYQKMLDELVSNYTIGVTEVGLKELVAKVGYKNERSDAIVEAKKIAKTEGKLQIDKLHCKLTEVGVEQLVSKESVAANPEEAMERKWEHLVMKLSLEKKTSSDKAKTSAKAIFDKLLDGGRFTKEELLKETHYGMVRSTGFPETLKAMKDMKMVGVESGKFFFTDGMFPFGKPEPKN
mmetsp:Transcript_3461/g.9573  ORF Transcript_3461/g.9573 Transcript_3461/m.9573 type:complete len:221 (+) Transcript_3461:356-1018(+)